MGYTDSQATTGFEYPVQFPKNPIVPENMLKDIIADNFIKYIAFKRKSCLIEIMNNIHTG